MTLEGVIQTLGLPGLALGSAAEGDAVAFLGGVLAHRGLYPFHGVVLALAAGAGFIDNLMFLAGRYAGRSRLVSALMRRGAVEKARRWLGRNADVTLLLSRFFWGMQTVTVLMIATTAIRWRRFALFDTLGALIWATVVAGAGFGAGHAIDAVLGRLALHEHLAVAGLGFAVVAGLWWWWQRGKRKDGKA